MPAATLADDATLHRIRDLVAPEMGSHPVPDAAHDLAHLDRVATLGRRIVEADGGDVGVVVAAAYCHDFHRVLEGRAGHVERVHPGECEHLVRDVLGRAGADPALVGPVLAAIDFSDAHAFAGPEAHLGPIEGRALHDADDLDAMGAIGIGRAFAFGTTLGHPLWEAEGDGAGTVLGHFHEKLLRLREGMLTPTGRALAEGRHEVLVAFEERFRAEWEGRV